MNSRLSDRLKRLEGQLMPPRRVFEMFRVEEPGVPPHAERLVAFKAEKHVGQHDSVVEVSFTFS